MSLLTILGKYEEIKRKCPRADKENSYQEVWDFKWDEESSQDKKHGETPKWKTQGLSKGGIGLGLGTAFKTARMASNLL
jgi:hypothetical protein